MSDRIITHSDLEVFQQGFDAAMRIFELSRSFPREETYSLTDQIRRSSRAVCSNIAEAWRKRRYTLAFVSKLNDAEAEAAETQVWLNFAVRCHYLDETTAQEIHTLYNHILGKLVNIINHPEHWVIKK
ncbi:MAG: four helix bundle protein [Chloroflexi bacterium]|nr:four helix bundle protein [Chloroflexota bacterium]MCI0576199.1 four helix bundle protein [Chloroflexota bacterium]MCI0645507.1 four helix bundle protein [Chloroflexota bacterium]MCI0730646.1 four helix bundle protein [Chloroflexota bacterium]